jgi:predicted HicB family RNase H-like nuclease
MIEYKGYTGVFEFDPSIDAFHGRVVGLRDVVTFQGRSLDELRREMVESVEDYLEVCAGIGKKPERPYRGEFLVRTTPELHRAAAIEAESAGMSLNAWVEAALTSVMKGARPPRLESLITARKSSRRKARATSES